LFHCLANRASLHVQAPQVRFVTRIKLSCVANNGVVRQMLCTLSNLAPARLQNAMICCSATAVCELKAADALLTCVGLRMLQVDPAHFHVLSQWQRHYNMEMVRPQSPAVYPCTRY
jgi:hypothetical protein